MKGKTFGRWKVIGDFYRNEKGLYLHECICTICESKKFVNGSALRLGKSTKCHSCASKIRGLQSCKNDIETSKFLKLYSIVRRRAIREGHCFELSIEEFKILIKSDCKYCGDPPSNSLNVYAGGHSSSHRVQNGKIIYQGIDRIDSSKGYVIDNCNPCCKSCNVAKNDLDIIEFKERTIRMARIFLKEINCDY